MHYITSNSSRSTRRDFIGPHEYLVASATLIVPGVLNGNQGPILYTSDENKINVAAWNHVPLTDDHPSQPTSARTPDVLKDIYLGVLLNAHVNSKGQLKGELWFDIEALNENRPGWVSRIESGTQVELSTGLGLDLNQTPGVTNSGEEYKAIAHNYKPDHVAILFEKKGACSLKDGCGVNNSKSCECGNCQKAKTHTVKFFLTENAKTKRSHDEIHHLLSQALNPNPESALAQHTWIQSVYDKTLIYERGGDLFKVSYVIDKDDSVTFGERLQVEKKIDYVPVSNVDEDENDSEKKNGLIRGQKELTQVTKVDFNHFFKGTDMTGFNRDVVINGLITNCECWTEEDKDVLNGFSDDKLKALATSESKRIAAEKKVVELTVNASTMPKDDEEEEEETDKDKKKKGEKKDKGEVMNNAGVGMGESPKTMDEFFASAPPEVREVFNQAKKISDTNKQKMIDRLVENATDEKKDSLKAVYQNMSSDQLETLIGALPEKKEPVQNYFGMPAPSTVQNSTKTDPIPQTPMVW
jgi:hypothetical protein